MKYIVRSNELVLCKNNIIKSNPKIADIMKFATVIDAMNECIKLNNQIGVNTFKFYILYEAN